MFLSLGAKQQQIAEVLSNKCNFFSPVLLGSAKVRENYLPTYLDIHNNIMSLPMFRLHHSTSITLCLWCESKFSKTVFFFSSIKGSLPASKIVVYFPRESSIQPYGYTLLCARLSNDTSLSRNALSRTIGPFGAVQLSPGFRVKPLLCGSADWMDGQRSHQKPKSGISERGCSICCD